MDKDLPNRRSIRLQEYDYSQEGAYFVTICCKDKICRFGKIIDGEMVLNELGEIAHKEWMNTALLRKNVELGEFVIMPNHIHGIIIINANVGVNVGANCIRPNQIIKTDVFNTSLQSPSQTLGAIIRGYKCAVTRQIKDFYDSQKPISIWQRNYYEHIIRDERSYYNISEYIIANPYNWKNDEYYNE